MEKHAERLSGELGDMDGLGEGAQGLKGVTLTVNIRDTDSRYRILRSRKEKAKARSAECEVRVEWGHDSEHCP